MKKRLIAGVLAILLGNFGLHKFYLKKNKEGIVYLLFCWTLIPAIIGLIEGIIYFVESDEEFSYQISEEYLKLKLNERQIKLVKELVNHTGAVMILMFISGGIPGIPYWIVKSKLNKHLSNETNPLKTIKFIFFFNGIIFVFLSIAFTIASLVNIETWYIILFFLPLTFLLFGIPTIYSYKFLSEQKKQRNIPASI
jgi:TM2 domain-containing membrane protein YozV